MTFTEFLKPKNFWEENYNGRQELLEWGYADTFRYTQLHMIIAVELGDRLSLGSTVQLYNGIEVSDL